MDQVGWIYEKTGSRQFQRLFPMWLRWRACPAASTLRVALPSPTAWPSSGTRSSVLKGTVIFRAESFGLFVVKGRYEQCCGAGPFVAGSSSNEKKSFQLPVGTQYCIKKNVQHPTLLARKNLFLRCLICLKSSVGESGSAWIRNFCLDPDPDPEKYERADK